MLTGVDKMQHMAHVACPVLMYEWFESLLEKGAFEVVDIEESDVIARSRLILKKVGLVLPSKYIVAYSYPMPKKHKVCERNVSIVGVVRRFFQFEI